MISRFLLHRRQCGLLLILFACCTVSASEFEVIENIPYKTGDLTDYEAERCKLDLYVPKSADNFATLIWFHGGALRNGHKADDIALTVCRRFASEGIAVASINYRLSPQVNFPAYIDDAAAAIAYLFQHISEHGGNPQRIFVSGHSAGGYLALMVGTDPQYLGKHSLRPTDIAGLFPVAGQTVTHSTVREERGIPKTRPIIDAAAPCYHVGTGTPPMLLIVGGEDLPMRAEENQYFYSAMKAVGHQSVTYLEVAGRNHGTIASRIGDPKDVVAQAMLKMIRQADE